MKKIHNKRTFLRDVRKYAIIATVTAIILTGGLGFTMLRLAENVTTSTANADAASENMLLKVAMEPEPAETCIAEFVLTLKDIETEAEETTTQTIQTTQTTETTTNTTTTTATTTVTTITSETPESEESPEEITETTATGEDECGGVNASAFEAYADFCKSVGDDVLTMDEYILVTNCVAHEAGSEWLDISAKAQVVEVLMNRKNSDAYPNDFMGIMTQKNQFSGYESYVYLDGFSSEVTLLVRKGVKEYFLNPEAYGHGYTGFWGDGRQNYFY